MGRTIPKSVLSNGEYLHAPGDTRWLIKEQGPNYTIADGVSGPLCGMRVIVSIRQELDGKMWLHVSCSYPSRLPTYGELLQIKRTFVSEWTALQVFPTEDQHVNIHPYCLHLWACIDGDVTPDFTQGRRAI